MNSIDLEAIVPWLEKELGKKSISGNSANILDRPFSEFSLDSATIVRMAGELSEHVGKDVPATAFYGYVNARALLQDLGREYGFGRISASNMRSPKAQIPGNEAEVAIVGIGCRFPKANEPQTFFDNLLQGMDCISPKPEGRWFDRSAARYHELPDQGGFLDAIDLFDPAAFGISAQEARVMDPQQRILLMVAQEALLDAGIRTETTDRSRIGVFIGASASEYGQQLIFEPEGRTAFAGTGNALSTIANRLSHYLGAAGPSMAIDTACSSSLVACHLAVKSLAAGECDVAIVGGVSAIMSDALYHGFAGAGMLSPQSRCKSFSDDADGYVRSEGCGVVILKRLEDAYGDSDRLFATIVGSVVNQDGRSTTLTAPNPAAQVELLRTALGRSGLGPRDLDYIEAHGTGTPLGDLIEASAISEVFSGERDTPLPIGSVKSNVGHLEAAAGITGLIKVALGLHRGIIPGGIHASKPNHRIDIEKSGLAILQSPLELTDSRVSHAGVSSFGFGGTNAHVVMRSPFRRSAPSSGEMREYLVPVSTASRESLVTQVRRLNDHVRGNDVDIARLSYSLLERRARKVHAVAFPATDSAQLANEMEEWLVAGGPASDAIANPHLMYVFPGQGSDWQGWYATLLRTDDRFVSFVKRCDEILGAELKSAYRLPTAINGKLPTFPEGQVGAQLASFVAQAGFVSCLETLIRQPVAAIAHSSGELAAAYCSGALTLQECLDIAIQRGELLASDEAVGKTLAVRLSLKEANALCAGNDNLWVAAQNSDKQITLAGRTDAAEELCRELRTRGKAFVLVSEERAFHPPHLAASALHAMERLDLDPAAPRFPVFSSVSGSRVSGSGHDAAFWAKNVSSPVVFAQAHNAALEFIDGNPVYLEVAPFAVLKSAIGDGLGAGATAAVFLPPRLPRKMGGSTPAAAAARLYELGFHASDARMTLAPPELTSLPFEGWDLDSYWVAQTGRRDEGLPPADASGRLGKDVFRSPCGTVTVWQQSLDLSSSPWLNHHTVKGKPVLPAAFQLATMLRASVDDEGSGIEQGRFSRMLELSDDGCKFSVLRKKAPEGSSLLLSAEGSHLDGIIEVGSGSIGTANHVPVAPLPPSVMDKLLSAKQTDGLYDDLYRAGLAYGPKFQVVDSLELSRDGYCVALSAKHTTKIEDGFDITLLDGAMHPLIRLLEAEASESSTAPIPISFERATWIRSVGGQAFAKVRLIEKSSNGVSIDLTLFDRGGKAALIVEGMALRIPAEHAATGHAGPKGLKLYRERWQSAKIDGSAEIGTECVVLLGGPEPLRAEVTAELADTGLDILTVGGSDGDEANFSWDGLDTDGLEPTLKALNYATKGRQTVFLDLSLFGEAGNELDGPAGLDGASMRRLLRLVKGLARESFLRPNLKVFVPPAQKRRQSFALYGGLRGAIRSFLKSVPFEAPNLHCQCIEIAGGSEELAQLIGREATKPSEELSIMLRSGERLVRRIERIDNLRLARSPIATRAEGASYLVTGGGGSLGYDAARWLADKGAGNIVCIGRSKTMQPRGVIQYDAITYRSLDIGDRAGLSSLFAELAKNGQPVRGIVHAAGVLNDEAMLDMCDAGFDAVFDPKERGATNLISVSDGEQLDWMIMFSSLAASIGSPGQANYCAANGYLDALAESADSDGPRVISVGWGPWIGDGMAEDAKLAELEQGLEFIDRSDGFAMLDLLLESDLHHVIVSPFEIELLTQHYPSGNGFPFYENLVGGQLGTMRNSGSGVGISRRRISSVDYVAPETPVQEIVAAIWRRVLGVEQIGIHDDFFELGGDSVMGNQVLINISQRFDIKIDPNEAFEKFNIQDISIAIENALEALVLNMDEERVEELLGVIGEGE